MFEKDSIFIRLVVSNIAIIILCSCVITFLSCYVSEQLIVDTFTSSNQTMLNQASNNLISFHNQIVNVSNSITLNKSLKQYLIDTPKTEFQHYSMLYHMQSYYESFSPLLKYLDLTLITIGVNGLSYVSNTDSLNIPSNQIVGNPLSTTLHYDFRDAGITVNTSNKRVVTASKLLRSMEHKTFYGALFITIDESIFRELYTKALAPANTLFILSKDGNLLSSSDSSLFGQDLSLITPYIQDALDSPKGYKTIKFKDCDYILLAKYVPYLDFYLVNTINKKIALEPMLKIRSFIFILSLIISFFTVIMTFIISRKISLPLRQMVHAMSNITGTTLNKPIQLNGGYEVRVLGHAYNTMLIQLSDYVRQLVKEQEQCRKAELHALQMQINPHFLYNTLSSVKYLAWQNHPQQIVTTIDALISLLQNTLGEIDECIPLSSEIDNLKNYVAILQTRYGKAIEVSYNLSSECMNYEVPKLILQPFIENAFFHAFNKCQKGTILVSIHKNSQHLICEIIDNGDGMEEKDLCKINSKLQTKKHFTGIGINNVDERIKLVFGADYGVEVTSKIGYGTCIKITLPS